MVVFLLFGPKAEEPHRHAKLEVGLAASNSYHSCLSPSSRNSAQQPE